VTEIDLKRSRIKKIKSNAFKALEHISEFKGLNKRVETLNLDYNENLEIEAKTFHYLPNLKNLILSNNKLQRFDSNIYSKRIWSI
jgi:Leucine-rich repeat (LRR) protein